MKQLFIEIIIMLFLLSSCAAVKIGDDINFGTSMSVVYCSDISQYQLDSICDADTLPYYDTWIKARFTDYETNTVFIKRMCFKNESDYDEIIYILIGENEPYKITKRITKQ